MVTFTFKMKEGVPCFHLSRILGHWDSWDIAPLFQPSVGETMGTVTSLSQLTGGTRCVVLYCCSLPASRFDLCLFSESSATCQPTEIHSCCHVVDFYSLFMVITTEQPIYLYVGCISCNSLVFFCVCAGYKYWRVILKRFDSFVVNGRIWVSVTRAALCFLQLSFLIMFGTHIKTIVIFISFKINTIDRNGLIFSIFNGVEEDFCFCYSSCSRIVFFPYASKLVVVFE